MQDSSILNSYKQISSGHDLISLTPQYYIHALCMIRETYDPPFNVAC